MEKQLLRRIGSLKLKSKKKKVRYGNGRSQITGCAPLAVSSRKVQNQGNDKIKHEHRRGLGEANSTKKRKGGAQRAP